MQPNQESPAMIRVDSISKIYTKNIIALSDVSFELKEGEIAYVLGESGSGKSTLLKLIAGLEDTNSGNISVNGNEITGPSQNLVPGYDNICYVPQDFRLQKFWTVRDNIAKKISFYTTEEKKNRVAELLNIFKLEDKSECFPLELSGGQQQRIALAAALSDQPEVMLLDEPFSNLDLPLKAQIRLEIIEMLQETGVTVMLVSHDPTDAMAFADQILILQNGQLIQQDDPKTVYDNPRSTYAAKFLGPINCPKR